MERENWIAGCKDKCLEMDLTLDGILQEFCEALYEDYILNGCWEDESYESVIKEELSYWD